MATKEGSGETRLLELLRQIHEAHFSGWSTTLMELIEGEVSAVLDEYGPASATPPAGDPRVTGDQAEAIHVPRRTGGTR